jgi:hypothetical protein
MAAANRRLASVARHMVQVDPEPAAATESSAGIAAFRLDGRTAFITGGARCASRVMSQCGHHRRAPPPAAWP